MDVDDQLLNNISTTTNCSHISQGVEEKRLTFRNGRTAQICTYYIDINDSAKRSESRDQWVHLRIKTRHFWMSERLLSVTERNKHNLVVRVPEKPFKTLSTFHWSPRRDPRRICYQWTSFSLYSKIWTIRNENPFSKMWVLQYCGIEWKCIFAHDKR